MIDTKRLREFAEAATPGPWIIDEENNLIRADDDRHTIVCNFSATLKNPSVMADASLIVSVFDLLAELDRVTAERDALRADAERYQYLVATCNIGYEPSEPWQLVIWEPNTGENWKDKLDAAIDAAIRASKGDA